jgi:hypothetical protein
MPVFYHDISRHARQRGSIILAAALAALSAGSAAARPAPAANGSAFVRVNQLGYPSSAPKRAYLLASVDETGASFSVMNGATAGYTAPIGARLGSWSKSFANVYALAENVQSWSTDEPAIDLSATSLLAVRTGGGRAELSATRQASVATASRYASGRGPPARPPDPPS